MIEHLLDVYRPLFDDIILVTNDPLKYLAWDLHVVTDIFSSRSSLTGIHAGLYHAAHPHAFIGACDAPFLQSGLMQILVDALDSSTDVIIPQTASGLEPLCAVYSRQCLAPIENVLNRGLYKIQSFFSSVRVRKIEEEILRSVDPDLISFFNINAPQDLERAETWLESTRVAPAPVEGDGNA